jgi:hypothetical protein
MTSWRRLSKEVQSVVRWQSASRTLRHRQPPIIVANDNAREITQAAAENHPILSILSVLLPVQKHQTIEHDSRTSACLFAINHRLSLSSTSDTRGFRGIWQLRRAVVTLLMQQSMLSRCIRQLQDALGVTVFERSSGGYARRRPDENFSSNGAIDTRTSGCARYIDALRGIF